MTSDLDLRLEKRPALPRLPSSSQVTHKAIKQAVAAFEKARDAENEARRAFIQARQELDLARERDQQALADALAAKKADPGNVHERDQIALIDEAGARLARRRSRSPEPLRPPRRRWPTIEPSGRSRSRPTGIR